MRDVATGDEDSALRRAWTWLGIAGLIVTTVIVALIALLGAASSQRDADLQLQERSYEVMILAASLDGTIAQSEAALGRFVISGDEAIGALYADDWRRAGALLDRLEAVARVDPGQSARAAVLRRAYNQRGEELGSAALRTTYRQNSEALATYYRIRTSPALSRIDAALSSITEHERGILTARSHAADVSLSRANALVVALSVLGIALIVGAGFLGWRIVEGIARNRREEARNAELEEAVEARTADLSAANERLITEMATRETAEGQLRQAQKMDAVGQLTGGIAHDFNNMLAVVLGGVELAKRRLDDGRGDPARHLDSAMEGANRAAALTKRLLAFARAEPLLPTDTNVDSLIDGMAELIDRTLGERFTVRHLAGAEGWHVFVDPHQLENALLNLAVNARDAMESRAHGGGTITIATARIDVSPGDVPGLGAGDFVRVSVSDTGSGIPPELLDRIFEPFFTTKPVGKGTGLGLSQIFGYVRQSHGAVTVDSAVGVGTTVSLYLPRHVAQAQAAPALAVVAPIDMPPRRQRLLVVEDDRRVMSATIDALVELGHEPIPCLDPAEAAALLDANPEVDLVLSDVLMPGISGPELIAELRRTRPLLRAVFATGFSGDRNETVAFGDDVVLRKPFTIASLGDALSRAVVPTASSDTAPALATSQAA